MVSAWKNKTLSTKPALLTLWCVLVDDDRLLPVDSDGRLPMVGRDNAIEPDAGADEPNRAGVAGHARVCVRAVGLKVGGRVAPRALEVALVDPSTHHFVRDHRHPVR